MEYNENRHSGHAQRVSDNNIVASLQSATKGEANPPVLSTSDVAELLPIGREATRKRLNELADNGKVKTYKAGRNPVWWPAPDEEDGGKILSEGVDPHDYDWDHETLEELIDPSEISKDTARQIAGERLENYSEDTKWEAFESTGQSFGMFGFTLVIGMFFLDTVQVSLPENVFNFAAAMGVLLALAGLPFWVFGILMTRLAKRDYVPTDRWPTVQEIVEIPRMMYKDTVERFSWIRKNLPL